MCVGVFELYQTYMLVQLTAHTLSCLITERDLVNLDNEQVCIFDRMFTDSHATESHTQCIITVDYAYAN